MKLVDRHSTYKLLHRDYNNASQTLNSQFLAFILNFEIIKTDLMLTKVEFLTANTLTECRETKILCLENNKCKIALDNPCSKLRIVSNTIDEE